jgi:benzylsuccinate CoA-transferase BbsF subunit
MDSRDILKGLRVIDFSWVGVGPRATRELAFYGAEVIRVESASRLDTFRFGGPLAPDNDGPDRSAYWANQNLDKMDITLNLSHEGAAEIVRRLVADADIVTESFAPGTMRRLGFDYDSLREIEPDVIMISMSMEGQGGPHEAYKGFGLVLQATAGITGLTSWPDRAPVGTGVAYTDWFATHLAVTSLLAALEHRDRTGEGQYIDLSQLEATIWGLDDAVLRYTATGELAEALGNRHPEAAPHGVFPCKGDDRWCAITVFTDDEWETLKGTIGKPRWADADGLSTVEGRKANEDDLEREISAWTAGQDAEDLATRLQERGVPAYPVNDSRGVQEDPQLAARGHFWEIEHPVIGPMTWDAPAYRLSGTPAYKRDPAPMLGQHNEYVYRELLGYSEEEFIELMVSGVLE